MLNLKEGRNLPHLVLSLVLRVRACSPITLLSLAFVTVILQVA